jgi:CHAT domain-containing protein/TolA-binding protein
MTGNAQFQAKDYSNAEQTFEQGLREGRRLGNVAGQARFLNSLGGAQFATFRYRQALRSYRQAHELALKANDGELIAITSLNLSSLYLQQQDINAALNAAEAGLIRMKHYSGGRLGPLFKAQAALLLGHQGRTKESLDLLLEAAHDADAMGDSEKAAMVWNQAGYEHLASGDLQAAEAELLEAYRIRLLKNSPDLAYSYCLLGQLRMAQGEAASALYLLNRAVALGAKFPITFPLWRLYSERGRAYCAAGRANRALADLERSMRLAARTRAELLLADSVWIGSTADQHETYAPYIRLRATRFAQTADEADARRAFQALEETQAAALRALLRRPSDWLERLPAEYWKTLEELRAVEGGLAVREGPSAEASADALLYRLTEMEAAAGVAEDAPPYGVDQTRAVQLSRRLQQSLQPGTALICYHLDEPVSFRWVVSRNSFKLDQRLSGRSLGELAQRFRMAIAENSPEARLLGSQLYEDLFGNLPAAARAAREWVLALDGELLTTPLAALVAGGTAEAPVYLAEVHSTRIVPSSKMLREPASHSWEGPFLGVGDPVYNTADPRWKGRPASRGLAVLASLPTLRGWFTAREEQDPEPLARLVGSGHEIATARLAWNTATPGELLSGHAVNLAALQAALDRRPSIVHFATHFVRSRGNPSLVQIALSINENGRPEMVSPSEISRWRHTLGAVVLSGCGSALAGVLPAEGLMGMTRAWLAAGAHSVVASIWPTADDNGDLFVSFYRHLAGLKGAPGSSAAVAEALRRAQVDMLRAGARRGSPVYWSAYIVVGKD